MIDSAAVGLGAHSPLQFSGVAVPEAHFGWSSSRASLYITDLATVLAATSP